MKKILCLILSAILIISTMSVLATAVNVPEITLKANKQQAKKDDTVIATIQVSKDSDICAATIELLYDSERFQVVSATANGTFSMEEVNSKKTGVVRYAATQMDGITKAATLFTVELKVVKPNGKLSLGIKEICVGSGNDIENVTSQVKANYEKLPEVIVACNHSMTDVVLREPTCENNGEKVRKCKHCDMVAETETIKATGHAFGEWTIVKEPTCDKTGEKVRKCKNCNSKTETEVIRAKGHTPGEWIVVKEATEEETGKRIRKCSVCGEIVNELTIPKVPKERIKGDVDGNGEVTAKDARMVLQYSVGNKTFTLSQILLADVNGDYQVTSLDARKVLQMSVGM